MKPLYIDRTSAVFPWRRHHNYTFVIKSRNAEGESTDNSTIFVPAWSKHHERSMSPQWIRNVYHATNRTYTLSWRPPVNQKHLKSYTVFWCQSKKNIPNECAVSLIGGLHLLFSFNLFTNSFCCSLKDTILFKQVNETATSFDVVAKPEQSFNLAVSANYPDFNSGMHWTMCAADVTSELAQLEPETRDVKARSIILQWSSERVCSSLVEGFTLKYCRINNRLMSTNHIDNAEQTCLEDLTTLTIPNTQKKYIMNNLKPFSSYKIQMNMFSKMRPGNFSNALIVDTTEEGKEC